MEGFARVSFGIVIIALGAYALFLGPGSANRNIDSFEECAAAGYPVAESYPEQCITPSGETFFNTARQG